MTEEEANTYFAQLNANGAISDDELELVAGGGGCPDDGEEEEAETPSDSYKTCKRCYTKNTTAVDRCRKCHAPI